MSVYDEQGRPEPPTGGGELETLVGFLDFQRATLQWRTSGLDALGLAATLAPSAISLGGLLKHVSYVEEHWFGQMLLGRPPAEPWASVDWSLDADWDWHSAADDSPDQLRALWSETVAASRSAVAEALRRQPGDLGLLSARAWPDGTRPSLRWILTHMVEEYARHNGHADLVRESIDGQTGE